MSWYLPALAGDDVIAYRAGGFLVGGGALLAGAWLALRDRTTGAAELVAVDPDRPVAAVAGSAGRGRGGRRRRVRGRVRRRHGRLGRPRRPRHPRSPVAGRRRAGGGAQRLGRAGRGPAQRLADGGGAGGAGVGGALRPDRPPGQARGPSLSVQHLAPVLNLLNRSAAYGFLPDPLWPHLGYLLGLTLLVGAVLVALMSRGGRQVALRSAARGRRGRPGALRDGRGQAARPPRRRAGARARPGHLAARRGRARGRRRRGLPIPAGASPTTATPGPVPGTRPCRPACTRPTASGRPGSSTRPRPRWPPCSPACPASRPGSGWCRSGWAAAATPRSRCPRWTRGSGPSGATSRSAGTTPGSTSIARSAVDLGPDHHAPGEAREAVASWALLAGGLLTRQEVARDAEASTASSRAAAAAALAMAELPADRVRAELAPVWDRLRAGTLPVAELPGQRP